MQEKSSLPLEAWASTLSEARRSRGLDLTQTARELVLSPAQIRGIESASLGAFHGEGYYLRAVEKYAKFLQVELTPPLQEMEQTDSQIALKRFNKGATVVTLAKREMSLGGAIEVPTGSRSRTRLGVWLTLTLGVVVAAGAYLAIDEGWPNNKGEPTPAAAIVQEKPPQTGKPFRPEILTPSVQPLAITIAPARPPEGPLAASEPQVTSAIAPGRENPPPVSIDLIPEIKPAAPATPLATDTASVQAPADIIQATFTQDCWVEIRFNDDRVEQKIYTPGERFEIRATDIKSLVFGNAQAVNAQRANEPWSVMSFTLPGGNVARIPQASLQKP